ncbi:MAG: hydrolase or metal-binding protein [Pseudomonadota bacterium]
MLKGLALTPPIIGRISIGHVVEKAGKRLPEKDDEFTITTQVQNRTGWQLHPLDQTLRGQAGAKLRTIPVRLLFNAPDLNFRSSYSLFNRISGRALCVGNGETCRRVKQGRIQTLPCPTPDACELAVGGNCKPFGRLNVRIGDDDDFGTFVFRTTGYNSIRSLSTRLAYFHAVSGGLLSTLPLELRLRGKSTAMSHGTPIFYVDLTVRTGSSLAEALIAAKADAQSRHEAGFNQIALDEAARQGFAAGAFEESAEEGEAVLEEFFPDESRASGKGSPPQAEAATLGEKLSQRAALLSPQKPGLQVEDFPDTGREV